MGFYKPMGEKHIKYLKKMKLPTTNTQQLVFQIISHAIKFEDIEITVHVAKNDTNPSAAIEKDSTVKDLQKVVKNLVNMGAKQQIKKRFDLINDPKEVIESLDFENFSVDGIENSFKDMLGKLEI